MTGARLAGDFSKASLKGTKLDGADLSADEKNQSMGLDARHRSAQRRFLDRRLMKRAKPAPRV